MTTDVQQLIHRTIELTGASPPGLMDADAPVLDAAAAGSVYLVGLVGGKDVGKSSMVNALAGKTITATTSHGPGTETVIAYAHQSAADELRQLLQHEVPGRFTIVAHGIDHLRRQVLVDLPDIDSRHTDHVQITRRMLRHMLYPLWIQSVEKYADARPQQLLAAVAEGNDPQNFIFCLNKADQIEPAAADELRGDFARRISEVLNLPTPPRVFLTSANTPSNFDLPALVQLLSREKAADSVQQSHQLAVRQQDRSLLGWFERQRLDEQSQRLSRMERDAEEIAAERLALPLLDHAIPKMLDDPALRGALIGPAVRLRLSRWPIVNAIDTLLGPVFSLVQKNLSASGSASADPDAHLDKPLATTVQSTFAQLHQLHPQIGELYQNRKLWEQMQAEEAATDLRRRFAAAVEKHRNEIVHRSAGRFAALFAPFRWLLTVGVLVWFPFIQPILAVLLQPNAWEFSKRTLLLVVQMLGVAHLLQCAALLLIWFALLWIVLRWSTQRRVSRQIERFKSAADELSLAGQTMQWIEQLLDPVHQRRRNVQSLVDRAEELRQRING